MRSCGNPSGQSDSLEEVRNIYIYLDALKTSMTFRFRQIAPYYKGTFCNFKILSLTYKLFVQ